MAKYKVGDKVRVIEDGECFRRYWSEDRATWNTMVIDMLALAGREVTIRRVTELGQYKVLGDVGNWSWTDGMFSGLAKPVREFIVIRRDGQKTIAELRHGKEVVKTGVAHCNPADKFDFQYGAMLAFSRLVGS